MLFHYAHFLSKNLNFKEGELIEKVAIIGMGVSGSAVLLAYKKVMAENPDYQVIIDCFDATNSFGRGVPFREPSKHALINSPSDAITYDFQDMSDFVKWLEENKIEVPEYSPRSLYGDYLHSRTTDLINEVGATAFYTKVKGLKWLPQSKQWQISLEDSSQLSPQAQIYDRVHLCCGELPTIDRYDLLDKSHYIHSAYPLENFPADINAESTVGIMGSGLSAIDVLKYLSKERGIKKMVVFSLDGQFPTVRGEDEIELNYHYFNADQVKAAINENAGFLTFEQVDEWIQSDLQLNHLDFEAFKNKYYLAGLDGIEITLKEKEIVGKMQSFMAHLAVVMTQIWEVLAESDRKSFAKKYNAFLNHLRNPMPPISAEDLLSAAKDGKLIVMKGVKAVEARGDGKAFIIHPEEDLEVEKVDWIINATGGQLNAQSDLEDFPLIKQLIDQRIVQFDSADSLSLNRQTIQIISPRFGEWDNLHAHGMLVNGVIYQNNSTIKIQQHSESLVRRLADSQMPLEDQKAVE